MSIYKLVNLITCTLDIRLRGEDQPRAQQVVSLLHTPCLLR
jgi:hypothetical protein